MSSCSAAVRYGTDGTGVLEVVVQVRYGTGDGFCTRRVFAP